MLKFFKRHKILAILLIIVLLWGIVFMCEYRRSSWYSEEQHIKRVSKRIDNHFKDWKYGNGERYESYKVYPLYEKDDTLQYFLVEFEPFGFSVIRLNKYERRRNVLFRAYSVSMYLEGGIYDDKRTWSPNNDDLTIDKSQSNADMKDDKEIKIGYSKSPYFVTGYINDKKYFIKYDGGRYICAIKKGNKFVNLISGAEFDVEKSESLEKQSIIRFSFPFSPYRTMF